MSNDIIILLAQINDSDRAEELLSIIGEGTPDTVEKAGAALQLFALGTGSTLADAVADLRDVLDRHVPGDPVFLAWQWLKQEHPELLV